MIASRLLDVRASVQPHLVEVAVFFFQLRVSGRSGDWEIGETRWRAVLEQVGIGELDGGGDSPV